jgi:hypothetical protein
MPSHNHLRHSLFHIMAQITDEQIESELLQDDLLFLAQAIAAHQISQAAQDFAAVKHLIDKLALDLGLYQAYYQRAMVELREIGLKIVINDR